MQFVRPKPAAWLWFLAAFTTTLVLGTWQVQRLQWKENLIAEIEAGKAGTPLTQLPRDEAELKPLEFRTVKLSGSWKRDMEFHLSPRFFKGTLGYSILSPLQLNDGRIVMVNRGWIPQDYKDIKTRPQTAPRETATITGILRLGPERGPMTPKNQPEKNIWFGRDVAAMAEQAQLKNVLPLTVDRVGTQDMKKLPVPSDGTIRLRNDHLSYVITWYGIAFSILVMFAVYHRKK
jgi:surfeit locus 1 family protein